MIQLFNCAKVIAIFAAFLLNISKPSHTFPNPPPYPSLNRLKSLQFTPPPPPPNHPHLSLEEGLPEYPVVVDHAPDCEHSETSILQLAKLHPLHFLLALPGR